jgi:adenylate cyclase
VAHLDAFLAASGVPAAEVDQAERDGTLELLVLEQLLSPHPPVWDLDTLAAKAELPGDVMERLWLAMGFPDPHPGVAVASDDDLQILQWADQRIRDPAEIDRTLQVLRVYSSSLARMAETTADDLADALAQARAAGLGDRARAELVLGRVDREAIERAVIHLYRLQLVAALRRRLAAGDTDSLHQELSVGFIDLVDFTAVSQELEPAELAGVVAEFQSRAFDTVAEHGAQVVKTIGDEIMFSSASPAAAVAIALRLAGDERRGPLTPDVRGGVAHGAVVVRWGDVFGPVVNLASRLVHVANPGAVLVSDDVRRSLADDEGLDFKELQPRNLKGIGRVPIWLVRLPASR